MGEEGETNDIYFGGKFDEEAVVVCFRKFRPGRGEGAVGGVGGVGGVNPIINN